MPQHPSTVPERGAVLLVTFLMMLMLAGLALAAAVFSQNSLATGRSQRLDRQALEVAEAGAQRARQAFAALVWTANSSHTETLLSSTGSQLGEYTVTISASSPYTITSDGYVPSTAAPILRRQVTLSALTTSTNLALNPHVVATASSSNGSNTPEKARDGATGSQWRAQTTGSGQWLKFDFQTATTVHQVIVDEDQNITGVAVAWSDDDSAWTAGPAPTVSGSGNNQTYTVTFAPDVSHRYVRATLTASGPGNRVGVDEMTVSDTAGTLAVSHGTYATSY